MWTSAGFKVPREEDSGTLPGLGVSQSPLPEYHYTETWKLPSLLNVSGDIPTHESHQATTTLWESLNPAPDNPKVWPNTQQGPDPSMHTLTVNTCNCTGSTIAYETSLFWVCLWERV